MAMDHQVQNHERLAPNLFYQLTALLGVSAQIALLGVNYLWRPTPRRRWSACSC
ncbi:MAG: hypothetical protein IPK17_11230 [Chloroflexi bacterium]|uniref:hypothetical protein n=1 Tax=Candidatus Flexifilum breve TaxID=3140694 RepID=UPI003135FD7C|nr:hypothetical protein [Chloroflexota bacterium]